MPDATRADASAPPTSLEMEALFAAHTLGLATGRDTTVVEANDEFLRILGRGRSDLDEGLDWTTITPDDHLERDVAALGEIARRGAAVVVKDFVRPDGTRVPVLASVTAVEQRPYRWIAVVIELSPELWSHRMAEAEAAIVASLLEDAPIGFALISPELRFVRVNNELAAMNGYSVADHEGSDVFALLPGLRESAEPLLRRVLDSGEPLRDVEIVGSTAADSGRPRIWLESFFPVRAPQGPILGVAAIARDVTEMRSVERELARTLARQRDALERLQCSLMPPFPKQAVAAGVDVAARYSTAAEEVQLGGDWFDVIQGPGGRVIVCVGDVVGHGLDAVGLMARMSASVRAFVHAGHDPATTLTALNGLLSAPDGPEGLATAVIVSLDPATGRLDYANAGHPCPLLHGAGHEVAYLTCTGDLMLGVDPRAAYTASTVSLSPGQGVLLFSDGLVESPAEDIDQGLERLRSAVREADIAGLVGDALLDHVTSRCAFGPTQRDDVCILHAYRHGRPT